MNFDPAEVHMSMTDDKYIVLILLGVQTIRNKQGLGEILAISKKIQLWRENKWRTGQMFG